MIIDSLNNIKILQKIKILKNISQYYNFKLSYLLQKYITNKIKTNQFKLDSNKINKKNNNIYFIDNQNRIYKKNKTQFELVGLKNKNTLYITSQ